MSKCHKDVEECLISFNRSKSINKNSFISNKETIMADKITISLICSQQIMFHFSSTDGKLRTQSEQNIYSSSSNNKYRCGFY